MHEIFVQYVKNPIPTFLIVLYVRSGSFLFNMKRNLIDCQSLTMIGYNNYLPSIYIDEFHFVT